MNDVFVYLIQMRPSVKGTVVTDENGDYTIYINSLYNTSQQQEIYNHEVRHILHNHHYLVEGIEKVECEANDKAALLGKIKKVEQSGLPLQQAILQPPPRRPVPQLPAYSEIKTIQLFNGQVYTLPPGVTPQQVLQNYEAWLERIADDEDRRRDAALVSGER